MKIDSDIQLVNDFIDSVHKKVNKIEPFVVQSLAQMKQLITKDNPIKAHLMKKLNMTGAEIAEIFKDLSFRNPGNRKVMVMNDQEVIQVRKSVDKLLKGMGGKGAAMIDLEDLMDFVDVPNESKPKGRKSTFDKVFSHFLYLFKNINLK